MAVRVESRRVSFGAAVLRQVYPACSMAEPVQEAPFHHVSTIYSPTRSWPPEVSLVGSKDRRGQGMPMMYSIDPTARLVRLVGTGELTD